MKKFFILISLLAGLTFSSLYAQKRPYNVVFDITSKDTVDHKMVMRWVNDISSTDPKANVEVVFYGKSLDMVTKDKSIMAETITKLSQNKNVHFKVCEIAMKNNNVDKNQ